MLEEIRIRGLGVIDDATLPLGPGLTAVTGETGAGKTMVVTGLLLLFGGRSDAARVRSGVDQAVVDGRIELSAGSVAAQRVIDAGGELDEGTGLVLRRVVNASGRSRGYVGGAPVPIAVLGELAEQLLTVHGQADQLRLTRPAEQRVVLDRFAGLDLAEFRATYAEWREADAQLRERSARVGELRREADVLAHNLAEIEAAAPQPGEDHELAVLAGRLAHADALRLASRGAHDALLGDVDAVQADAADISSLLALAARTLGQVAGADAELDALTARLDELAALAADLGSDFGRYADGLDADPQRLEQVEARRGVLTALVRKFAGGSDGSAADVLAWAAQAAQRLAELDVSDEALAALARRRDDAAERTARLAEDICEARSAAAQKLAAAVSAELGGLAMPDARLHIEVRRRPVSAGSPVLEIDGAAAGIGSDGADEVEFLLQPHREAPALPLARAASGGELSRIMLALELSTVGTADTADPAAAPTMVFDEIDAGVGGRAAVEVGRRLAWLARDRQVLVVTHLAQVAAHADHHVVVDKSAAGAGGQIVASDVRVVEADERVGELARMLAGSATGTAREHAAELLASAAEDRGIAETPSGVPR